MAVEFLQDSVSKEDARKNFLRSCDLCCNRGYHLDCGKCEVKAVYKLTIAIFDDMANGHIVKNK